MTMTKLPFNLLSDEISIWLASLEQQNSAKAAIELNNAAKALRRCESNSNDVLKALVQLTPLILQTCNTIELAFLTESPSNKYPQKVIRLCIQLLRNTALALSKTNKSKNVSNADHNLSIYMALQFIGQTQRLSALFHESPSASLWKEMGRIYNLALQTEANQQGIKHKIDSFKDQLSIETVLKRNILFNLFIPYQYSDKQIKELFLISNTLADKLEITSSIPSPTHSFYWDSNSNTPPSIINNTVPCQQVFITINTKDVLIAIQMSHFICNLDKELILKLIDCLSGYQLIINNPIPSPPTISHLFTGFKNITEHLTKVCTLQKIQQLSTQTTSQGPLSIQSKDARHNNLNAPPAIAYSSNYKDLLSSGRPVKTLQVSNERFTIAETGFMECDIGDIALLCHHNLTNKIGVIRQVKATNSSKTVHILIEEIAGNASTPAKENKFISITNENFQKIIFPSPCKQSNGSKLQSASGDSYTLEQLIDYSPFFSLYQANTI